MQLGAAPISALAAPRLASQVATLGALFFQFSYMTAAHAVNTAAIPVSTAAITAPSTRRLGNGGSVSTTRRPSAPGTYYPVGG